MLERGPDQPKRKKSALDTIQKALGAAVEDDAASGVHRVSREIFTDPDKHWQGRTSGLKLWP
jgi:hypothetical protein